MGMETLRTWVLLLCGVALASAAIGALLPQGQSKTAFRVLTGVVFLYALVLPLKNWGHAQALPDSLRSALPENEQALSQKSADARLLAANQVLEAAIADALRTAGYPDASVRVQCAAAHHGARQSGKRQAAGDSAALSDRAHRMDSFGGLTWNGNV